MAQLAIRHLGTSELETLFGAKTPTIGLWIGSRFQYAPFTPEHEEILLATIRDDLLHFTPAGPERKQQWEIGWRENLEAFRERKTIGALVPKYYRDYQPLRLHQHMVWPVTPRFELNWFVTLLAWLFKAYLGKTETVYEFGCGSGFNLAGLAYYMGRDKAYVGLDWAQASVDILDDVRHCWGLNIEGRQFDLFQPDYTLQLAPDSVVLTVATLEQTGRNYEEFLQYLLSQRPALCVNIEPIVEWYDPDNDVDQTAILYHRARNYLEGFPQRLKELEREGRVEILKMKRSYFGSLYHEGYSQVIWRPL